MACLLSFLNLMESYMYQQYIQFIEGKEEFVASILGFLNQFAEKGFSKYWFELLLFQYATCVSVVKCLSALMTDTFGVATWEAFFELCFFVVNAEILQVDKLPPGKQQTVTERYGDLRIAVVDVVIAVWDQQTHVCALLHQVSSHIIRSFRLPECREKVVNFMLQLIEQEFQEKGAFPVMTATTIDTIDIFAEESVVDDVEKLLVPALAARFAKGDDLGKQGDLFLSDFKELMAKTASINMLSHDPAYEDERTLATLKLMEVLKESGRHESYVKYAHKLAHQHLQVNNFNEAALTILLHANNLGWSDKMLDTLITPKMTFKQQAEKDRKEILLSSVAEYFEKAKNWENGTHILTQLSDYYEERHDYAKLATTLRRKADLCENIATKERFLPNYFRIGCYGQGFPQNVRNKTFIYRGKELERIDGFTGRMQTKFPNATKLTNTTLPGDDIKNAEGQYILITMVQPSSEKELNRESVSDSEQNVPLFIRMWKRFNDVNIFSYSRPFKKSKVKDDNEFKDLWINKTFFVTEQKLPSTNLSTEVIRITQYETTPLENAVSSIVSKTEEIHMAITKYSGKKDTNISPFTSLVNGVVDAAVNGGIKNYQEAFLTEEYASQNPADKTLIEKLRTELDLQCEALRAAVDLHAQIHPAAIKELHQHIAKCFADLEKQIKCGQAGMSTTSSSKLSKLL
eukprot:TRINITY_DN10381_c0_g1_i1.p1 TRINITY_DN10381_c0_g1~~TRINITY_DN10381_c0_g1_i1.p1  ORF type:complete len:707 (+),score=106.84 TRINITY_DN10381_c0_g1_i1:58-2121(+)